MEEGNGEMKVRRHCVGNRARYNGRYNDVSVVYMLLLMVLTILGCNSQDVGGTEKKETDDSSASGDTGRAPLVPRKMSGSPSVQPKGKDSDSGHHKAIGAARNNFFTRILSHDRKQRFSVFLSLVPLQKQTFYLRDMLVSPYYDELFACGRVHQKEKDTRKYQVHFKIVDEHRIIFNKLTAGADDTKIKLMSRNDSKVAGCLLGIYRNSIVELSGTVPVTRFFLSFDFRK
jgi:hypothetical protein